MREILPLLPRPTRYLGIEPGLCLKDPDSVRVRMALAFPDLYEIGMSYTGRLLLYHAVNSRPEFYAEHLFAPCKETARILKEKDIPLATLETDTNAAELDLIGFSITHELCYTNILYMLDLAGIPLRSRDRYPEQRLGEPGAYPVIAAGGGCTFNAEPVAPFLDFAVLGDGEIILPQILEQLREAKENNARKADFLRSLKDVPGVYVPTFFQASGKAIEPLYPDYSTVSKCIVPDPELIEYPVVHPQPFSAVHDRFVMEIARGCSRGCRFCQAGMIYRPVRERSTAGMDLILQKGLEECGYDELSFLSLSTGDFSALSDLFSRSIDRCRAEQISISLPSLRVGSVTPEIIGLIAGIRRTGATLAPEAGSERLRQVINKGITEQQLLDHARFLFENGWQSLKLYFMINLPTETEEDLREIPRLCRTVEEQAGADKRKRLQVTAAVSPFVPKPHTPFQWERQPGLEETRDKIDFLKSLFRSHRRLKLRFHMPEMSYLEGVFSRGDRALADAVELGFRRSALFSSWKDHLNLPTWLDVFSQCGINPDEYLRERDQAEPLPWDHLQCGVSKEYLLKERRRSREREATPDCRYGRCSDCGVCDQKSRRGLKVGDARTASAIGPRVNLTERDQSEYAKHDPAERSAEPAAAVPRPQPPSKEELAVKAGTYRLQYRKVGRAAYLSQRELQAVFERAFRRAGLAMAFSQGFHPLPLLSFDRALPVGTASLEEYMRFTLREHLTPQEVLRRIKNVLPKGLEPTAVEEIERKRRNPMSTAEYFRLETTAPAETPQAQDILQKWQDFTAKESFELSGLGKKGTKTVDIRKIITEITFPEPGAIEFKADWSENYLSPLTTVRAILPDTGLDRFTLTKTQQEFVPDEAGTTPQPPRT